MQYQRMCQMLGMKPEKNLAGLNEELRSKLRPGGADEVRSQLLLEAVGEREKIDVSDAELETYIAEQARARNTPPAKLRAEWVREGRMDGARFSLRQDKVLDFLVSKAVVTEVDKLSEPAGDSLGAPVPTEPAHGDEGHVHGPDCDH